MTPKVTVHKHQTGSGWRWVVSRRVAGKRQRSFFESKALADAEASRLRALSGDAGELWASLSASKRNQLVLAYAEAHKRGMDLYRVATAPAQAAPEVSSGPGLGQVVAEVVAAKKAAGRSPKYLAGLRIVLEQFSRDRDGLRIGEVGLAHVEKFLDSKSLASRPTLRSRLSTLFRFAIRRGYRADDPCARLEPVRLPHTPPAIFTVEQAGKALKWIRAHKPRVLPWFILTTFCGLRPEEAEKTTRGAIHFAEGWIKVEAQTSKIRQRRVVYPKSEALALLEGVLVAKSLPLPGITRRRAVRALRDYLGLKRWPKDITRHSAASYWLADCQSAAAVAESLGHSETVLRRHYKALVTAEQARAFWALK